MMEVMEIDVVSYRQTERGLPKLRTGEVNNESVAVLVS